ncbi:MAG TPA: copper resistance protein CopC [Micromonosporaceae bacterium]
MVGVTSAPRSARLGSVLLGLLLGVLVTALWPARPAAAHASQVGTVPTAGSVVSQPPTEVVVTFSEPVQAVPAKTGVTGPDGRRADSGRPTVDGPTLHIPLRTGARGTYLVSYRVISADGHPVGGGFTYSVGAPSATVPVPSVAAGTVTDPLVSGLLTAARYLGYAGLVLLFGPVLVLAALWPRRLSRRTPTRLAFAGLGLVAVGCLAEFYLQVPYSQGTSLFGITGEDLRAVLGGRYGSAHLVRLFVLGAAVFPLRPLLAGRGSRADRVLLAVLAVIGLLTWPVAGHPSTSKLPPLTVVADTAHLAAMAVWLGGLLMLAIFLLPRGNARELGAVLPVWSRWATWAVVVLAAAGLTQAVIEIGSPHALVATTYGRLVIAKAALLAVVLVAAWFARRLAHATADAPPQADRDPTADPPQHADPVRDATAEQAADAGGGSPVARLRRAVVVELALTAVVLALSAVLVQQPPAGNAQSGTNGQANLSTSLTLTSDLYSLQVDVDPGRTGPNTIHIYAYTPNGQPLPVKEWKVTASLPAQQIEAVDVDLLPITENHEIGQIDLPVPGRWQLRFTLRTSDIDEATVAGTVTITK